MAAPQGTAARFVEVAKAEVGTVEGPKDNQTKYGAFTKANFQPWCGSFVMWCANEAGVKVPNTVYTPGGAQAFQKMKRWFTDAPQAGDVVYFDFPGDGVDRISHVGIVIKDNKDGTCETIEGNTSGTGDQRNGGMVLKKTRGYAKNKKGVQVSIVGFGRPNFEETSKKPAPVKVVKEPVVDPLVYPGETIDPGESGVHVKTIQQALGVPKPDGIYGPVTKKAVIAFQKSRPALGTPDGVVGPKTWNAILKAGKLK